MRCDGGRRNTSVLFRHGSARIGRGELERNLKRGVKFCGPGVDVVNFMSDRSEECEGCEQSSVVKCGSW